MDRTSLSSLILGDLLNPLERLQEQRAERLLGLLQADIRAKVRSSDEYRLREQREAVMLQLASPRAREKVWNKPHIPSFKFDLTGLSVDLLDNKNQPINSLPSKREYWRQVDVHRLNRRQLDAICELVDLRVTGRKQELLRALNDWIYEPEQLERKRQQRQQQLDQENELAASSRVWAFGTNANGELGQGHRREANNEGQIVEIHQLRGAKVTRVVSVSCEQPQQAAPYLCVGWLNGSSSCGATKGLDARFAFAVTSTGAVYTWGGDSLSPNLELFPDERDADTALGCDSCWGPRCLAFFNDMNALSIACASTTGHVAVLSSEYQVFTWGNGESGQLGTGAISINSTGDSRSAAEVCHVTALSKQRITGISVGSAHTAAITSEGKLYTWGACWAGQLGLGDSRRIGETRKAYQRLFPSPTPVEALSNVVITKVSCGALHTAVLSNSGQLFTFGCNDGGRLGLGLHVKEFSRPLLVTSFEPHQRVVDVACGNWHSLCLVHESSAVSSFSVKGMASSLDAGGTTTTNSNNNNNFGWVYVFGYGLRGQLGLGKQKSAAFPTRIPSLYERKLPCRALAVSSYHSCVLTCDGRVFTWGRNSSNCLGRPTAQVDVAEPEEIVWQSAEEWGVGQVSSVAVGDNFTVFVTDPWQGQLRDTFQGQFALNTRHKRKLHYSLQSSTHKLG